MPNATAIAAITPKVAGCHAAGIHLPSPNQMSAAAADPQVPGPGFIFPAPKKVATKVAQSEAEASACPSAIPRISFFISVVAKVLDFTFFRVLHRRGHYIFSAGPFAKINHPATFAAEREVLGAVPDRLLADRALQLDLGFVWHKSIVDGKLETQEDTIENDDGAAD